MGLCILHKPVLAGFLWHFPDRRSCGCHIFCQVWNEVHIPSWAFVDIWGRLLVNAEQSCELWFSVWFSQWMWAHFPLCVGETPISLLYLLVLPQGIGSVPLLLLDEGGSPGFPCCLQGGTCSLSVSEAEHSGSLLNLLLHYPMVVLGWLIVSQEWMSGFPTWPVQEWVGSVFFCDVKLSRVSTV